MVAGELWRRGRSPSRRGGGGVIAPSSLSQTTLAPPFSSRHTTTIHPPRQRLSPNGLLRNVAQNHLDIAQLLDCRQAGSWHMDEKSATRTRGLSLSTILPRDPPFRSDSTISQRSMSLSVHRTQRLWNRVHAAR